MERAAFKFTPEYLAVLGGKGSDLYEEFVGMFTKGLLAARKYASVTVTLIEIMMFQVISCCCFPVPSIRFFFHPRSSGVAPASPPLTHPPRQVC